MLLNCLPGVVAAAATLELLDGWGAPRRLLRARRGEDLGVVGHAPPVIGREVALPACELDLGIRASIYDVRTKMGGGLKKPQFCG